jgi:hypothetical protein
MTVSSEKLDAPHLVFRPGWQGRRRSHFNQKHLFDPLKWYFKSQFFRKSGLQVDK